MFDSFPFDEWSEEIAEFWTFGPGGSTGTYILTILGVLLMVGSFIGFVWMENQKLERQAAALRAMGGLDPAAAPDPPGTNPAAPGRGDY